MTPAASVCQLGFSYLSSGFRIPSLPQNSSINIIKNLNVWKQNILAAEPAACNYCQKLLYFNFLNNKLHKYDINLGMIMYDF